MKTSAAILLRFAGAMLLAFALGACEKNDPNLVQGYIEGEYVYVAAPGGGQLKELAASKGAEIGAGAPLFALDDTPERASRDEAVRRLAQARATAADARLGQRPTELQTLEAQLSEAKAALVLAEREFERQSELLRTGVTAPRDLDIARSQRDQGSQQVAQLTAQLETAKLGSRAEQIVAADQAVLAQEAVLAGAEWNLAQKRQQAPVAGLVHDTLYRVGDWVKPGAPVVVLLPPGNVKVRAFVSQGQVGRIQPGDIAQVFVDGVAQPYAARVTYIASHAEFTPPVIYSQKMREKFVFMVELSCEPEVAKKLHPGQPVDIRFSHHG